MLDFAIFSIFLHLNDVLKKNWKIITSKGFWFNKMYKLNYGGKERYYFISV